MAATAVAAAAHAGLRGVGGAGGGDRGSIYRNGDLYIARRGLCIASTHSAQSPPSPPPPPAPPAPLTADPRYRERTAPHCERSRVGSWVRGGCRGVAGATVRHGGVIRGAGRFNETRPHHPLRAGRARLLVRRNASPIQLPRSQGTSARARATDATAFPLRHAATPLPAAPNVASRYNRNRDRPGFRANGRFVRFPELQTIFLVRKQSALALK